MTDTEQAKALLDELHRERLSHDQYCLLWDTLDAVEAERDAAIKDLEENAADCMTCKFGRCSADEAPCLNCGVSENNWKWRGLEGK